MNILIIDNSVAFTGAFKCALNEAEILSGEHNFTFVLPEKSSLKKTVADSGHRVYRIPILEIRRSFFVLLLYPFILLRNTFALQKIVKKENIDLVQVNDFYNMLGVMLRLFGFKGKLVTYVRFLPSVMPGPLRKIWTSLGIKYSTKIIAVSDAVKKQLPQHEKIVRIYDPVMLSEKQPPKQTTEYPVVSMLYLANYIQGKGQDSALEAFILAYQKNKNIRLTFTGGDMGLEKNAEYRQTLEKRVSELKLNEVVKFEPFNADVESVIKNADIALNFSEAESFSMTCLEAAYYGTALIATRCGGPEEIIDNGKTGITIPVKDTSAMCNAMLKLAGDTQLRNEYAIAGKEYVRQKFNIENYTQQIKSILQ